MHGLLCLPGIARLAKALLAVTLPERFKGLTIGLRHVFLHVLRVALLTPFLFFSQDIGFFIGSLVESGRGVAPVFLLVVVLLVA